MSTNCIHCGDRPKTGNDLLCDECRRGVGETLDAIKTMPNSTGSPTDDQLRKWASLPTFNNCAPPDQQRKRNQLVILSAELLKMRTHFDAAKITQPEELKAYMVASVTLASRWTCEELVLPSEWCTFIEALHRLTRTDSDNPSDDNPEQRSN